MKTARYQLIGGGERIVEYDENAPCIICGEPVVEASMGGTAICPSCDCGRCRYCGVGMVVVREEIDGGRSLRGWREHMKWHKQHPTPSRTPGDATLGGVSAAEAGPQAR